ncbi:MAG: EF-P lysine aminoacylase EpmA [Pseudomonadota bacterium]
MPQTLAAKKPVLRLRARIVSGIRRFFEDRGYLEIETPVMIPAPAPEPHISTFKAGDLFLHPSPELCMKRLLASGYDRIFQICHCFREGERGTGHLPEFTLLEWYRAGADYLDLMGECEELLLFLTSFQGSGKRIHYQGMEIHLESPWDRLSVHEAFQRYGGLSPEKAMETDRFDEVMVEKIEPRLGIRKPVFLYDYPAPLGSLARLKKKAPHLAERFELYIGGVELANAFTELTDAREQRKRFERDRELRKQVGMAPCPLPEKFLDALPRMPPSAGIALGVDRLVMILADRKAIDDVVAFTPEIL